MKRIKSRIKAFIIRTIIEDYKVNGPIRQMVAGDWLQQQRRASTLRIMSGR